jgi:glycosyltransferase involved in cell wall biosynthesis
MMGKLLFIVNIDKFFVSHRLPIALEAIKRGYEVHIATTITKELHFLEQNGLIVHPLNLHRSRSGISIFFELWEIFSIFIKVKPDIVHLVTIKPVLLGGLVARILRTPAVVSAVSGLGYIYINDGIMAFLKRRVISFLYYFALGHSNQKVIFQNTDDSMLLSKLSYMPISKSILIPGSGVDLSLYRLRATPSGIPIVLFAARLLKDKGVNDFVNASKIVNKFKLRARFVIYGDIDLSNPSSINQEQLSKWEKESDIELRGFNAHMEEVIPTALIVALPSYREGFPKVLIEAAACGRAVVTTNVPGCRDAIVNNVTGILIPKKDSYALANSISFLLDNPVYCKELGKNGRKRAEKLFSIKKVTSKHMDIYRDLLLEI